MQRRKILTRVALLVGVLLVVALVSVAVVGTSLARRPFPQVSGEIRLAGLTAAVEVRSDARGIPHIYADNPLDLFRAQGYVSAQDRFFEMDLRRHITSGRLAELVGSAGLETDKVTRTLGWRRVAEKELALIAPATRSYLDAYAEGVNDYLHERGDASSMGLAYSVLGMKNPGYKPEDWSAVDSLAWLKAMAWDLRGDYNNELSRAQLAASVHPNQLAFLFPPYPYDTHLPILSSKDWVPTAGSQKPTLSVVPPALQDTSLAQVWRAATTALDAVPPTIGRGDGIGSNSWVVGPTRSSTGHAMLANDPHLGIGLPGIWMQFGLHCRTVSSTCPFDVEGFGFSGFPGVVIGHNAEIAWAFTNLGPDVTDFYLEKITGATYERDYQQQPVVTRQETLKVAGGADVALTVRETVHGPVISDVIDSVAAMGQHPVVAGKAERAEYAVSLAWTGLVPSATADAIFALDAATTFAEFREAARLFAVPSQNLLYADTAGHIGYQSPGLIPIRSAATPGAPAGYWPAPGWDSQYDWRGWVPFEDLPTSYDPPEGYLVAANQAVTASSRPFLTTEWDYGYRAQRIRDLLTASPTVTPQQMASIQLDTVNGFAATMTAALLAVDLSDDTFTRAAQDLLKGWDYTQPADTSRSSAAAAYFNAVWARVLTTTFSDEANLQPDGGARWMAAVTALLKDPSNPWWDDKSTPGVVENEQGILRTALVDARLDLTKTLGKDPTTWRWGRLHTLTLQNSVLGGEAVPGPIRSLFTRGPYQMPGGSAIVNALGWDASTGYTVNWGPSMRMVVDLGNLDASTWVNQTGQSGHPFTPHYDDQIDAWVNGQTFPWPSSRTAVEAATVDVLTLLPSGS
ncbi:MAG: penicillin acylase family protein [Candidatus Lutibacillus vidarii]